MITGKRRRSFPFPELPGTIPALVRMRAEGPGADRIYLRFIDRTTETLASATYRELHGRVCGAARELSDEGVRAGDRVMLLMESRLEFYYALFGAMRLGALPVAVYPPLGPELLPASLTHLRAVAKGLDARAIVCSQQLYGVANQAREGRRMALLTMESVAEMSERGLPEEPKGEGPVLLQYTSGSLGAPRAIELGTNAIYANLLAIGDAFDMRPGDQGLSWLPLYHDMGLHSIFFGLMFEMPAIFMSPLEFLKKPSSWLRAIGRYRVTHSPAPNFGYAFAARRAREADLGGVDLSTWRVAMCGAEPIDQGALSMFADRFEPLGFSRASFMAAYGLAENTVAVTFAEPGTGLRVDRVDGDALRSRGVAEPSEGEGSVAIVSVGAPIADHDVRVVDEGGREIADGQVGEIQVRGASGMIGYRDDPDATRASFDGDFLRTGDLGYVRGGEVYITGRRKDLIIRGGRNYYPQDIEAAATIEGIRPGGVAAFGRSDARAGTEDVVVVAEVKRKKGERGDDHALAEKVKAAVHHAVGVHVGHVELVEPGAVPKTTSGKLRRAECKARFEAKTLVAPRRPALDLLARVGIYNALPARAQRWLDRARRLVRGLAGR